MSLEALIRDRSLIICVGPGGVGKTTVSAAVALAAATQGRRTLVLTIDPARRLADALGLPGLDDEIRQVPTEKIPEVREGGELHAAMVDTGRSWDSLVRRIAPDPETLERILENRVFQAMSRSMARSHAYVAMERLYAAMEDSAYDLVVLDTPPARNALDILDAPAQLARFLDAKIVGWFLPGEKPQGLTDRLIARGGQVAKKLLGLVTGDRLLSEILAFLEVFADLREGFANRAERVDTIVRGDDTAFCLVTSANPGSADDAAWLREDLERRRVAVDAVVFNQSFVPVRPSEPREIINQLSMGDLRDRFARLAPHLSDSRAWDMLEAFRQLRIAAATDNGHHQGIVDGIAAELPDGCTLVRTPRFDDEIRDLPGLLRLSGFFAP